jgi:hypothetical protein
MSLAAVASPALQAAEAPGAITGRLAQITHRSVIMEDGATFQFDSITAQCFDHRSVKLTCETLVAVGYVDMARLTVTGTTVTRIDVVRLQQ